MHHPQLTTHNRQQGKNSGIFRIWSGWLLVVSCLWFPTVASASLTVFKPTNQNLTFTGLVNKFSDITNAIIPFLIGVAFVAIIWGIFNYVRNAGDSEKVAEGRKVAIYGVIALFLMLSFWGFVMIIKKSLFES